MGKKVPAKPRAARVPSRHIPPAAQPSEAPIRGIGVEEFVRRLRADTNADKRFALFLGAGCSVSSGIPSAGELVRDRWIPRLRDYQAPDRSDLDAWARSVIRDYDPRNPDRSYGSLIELLFLHPEDRQREIEDLCEGRTPSFGYAVLAQLVAMERGRFNVVLTTNFDDLIADALYLYTEARPLVIHHESLAAFIRPTRTRPLVVKLHGDHRLAPRNTAVETQALELETQRHTAMALHDRGVIFMGYGGADVGILKLLNDLPREALPYGAYWVHPHEPHGEIRDWLVQRRGVWVRSGWFDEVMLLVRNVFDLPHPSADRFNQIFQSYHQKFSELSASIQAKPAGEAGVQALKKALTDTEALFTDYWKVMSEARQLRDADRAQEVYRQGVTQFPRAAPLLGNYAVFLKNVRKDYDAAEVMYKRALEADPKIATNLSNYANFLQSVRKDYDAAEAMYKRALEVDPKNATSLSNYATLLGHIRKDYEAAEAMYKRALEVDPKNANVIGSYATFLDDARKDYGAAEAMYKRALKSNPKNANSSANFARLLLANGNADGLPVLRGALESLRENPIPVTELECAFYLFAHGPQSQRIDALRTARRLLESDVRSPDWDLSRNVERARLDGHSEGPWLAQLAAVISDDAQLGVLSDWPAWKNAA